MKDAFAQWTSIYNNLIEESGGKDRIFIQTEDNKLLYFDGYENITAKKYTETSNKIVKSITEEKQSDEYGGHITNIRITFTDGSDLLFKDIYRNFFVD